MAKPIDPDVLIARLAVHLANARLIADARAALDATGRAVAAFDATGALAWASPRARSALAAAGFGAGWPEGPAREAFRHWLAAIAPTTGVEEHLLACPGGVLRLTAVGRSASGDVIARVQATDGVAAGVALARAFDVTEREGEVLAWVARGKSNRDIADILGLSPRTVTKHVEQIFVKLGVENRTAAAALCLRRLD